MASTPAQRGIWFMGSTHRNPHASWGAAQVDGRTKLSCERTLAVSRDALLHCPKCGPPWAKSAWGIGGSVMQVGMGLVGAGAIGQAHARSIRAVDAVSLAAVCTA